MKAVIQRVKSAEVRIASQKHAEIRQGLLILLGIEHQDCVEDVEWLAAKISKLRVFNDENHVMNLSVSDIKGECLLVSQFTLHATSKKVNRPSYIRATPQ